MPFQPKGLALRGVTGASFYSAVQVQEKEAFSTDMLGNPLRDAVPGIFVPQAVFTAGGN